MQAEKSEDKGTVKRQNCFKNLTDARTIMNTQYPPIKFIVKDIIPAQGFILLAGMPKAGKSLLILLLLLSVTGKALKFLGHIIETHVKALYICLEDPEARLKERIIKMGFNPTDDNLRIATTWDSAVKGGMNRIVDYLKANPEVKLIVIDTKGKFFEGRENENFQQNYDDMAALKEIADKMKVAIILITHLRKKPYVEDEFEAVSGTVGNTAAPDTVIMLKRARNQNKGELYLTSRDFQERKLDIFLDNRTLTWKAAGNDTAKWENLTPQRIKILTAIYEFGGNAKPAQIAAKVGGTSKNISNMLSSMAQYDFVEPDKQENGLWKLSSQGLAYFEQTEGEDDYE